MDKPDIKVANNIFQEIPRRLQRQIQCADMCKWVKAIVRMVNCHDIEPNFLKAPAQHRSSCTNFDNQRFRPYWCVTHAWTIRLSRWLVLWFVRVHLVEGHVKRFCEFGLLYLLTKSGVFPHWAILICVIGFVAAFETTNMQSLATPATCQRQCALVQIVIKANGISILGTWNSLLKALWHFNRQRPLALVLAFTFWRSCIRSRPAWRWCL